MGPRYGEAGDEPTSTDPMTITQTRPGSVAPRRMPPALRQAPQRPRFVPTLAVYKAPSKWTAVAAFIVSVAIHLGAVLIVEMRPEESREVAFEAAASEATQPRLPKEESEPLDAPQ